MNKKIAIIISPNWQDYAEKYLADCVKSIRGQDYQGEMKIFITDNETSPKSLEFLAKTVPEAKLILNKDNDGFAKGVNDSIRQALKDDFDYLAVFNIHTELRPNCLREMIKALESDEQIGVVQARLMLWPEKDKISSLGNATHFLGFGYCLHYRDKYLKTADLQKVIYNIHYPSGSSMLFRRETLEKIGLLDEEYWMYNEDQEIGWRLWLAGYRCVAAPKAVLYNKYEFKRSIKKFYWLDRNRIISILICYKIPTLFLIFPAFIIMELGQIMFSLKHGWFGKKLRVWAYFLRPKTWAYLRQARQRNQSLRQVKDKEIIKLISGRIWYQEVGDWKLRLINPVFNLYWNIIRRIIKW